MWHTADTVCTKRTYNFDNRTNRKALTSVSGVPGADCPSTGGTTTNHAYDSADRLVDTGYVYDAFGRTTALPGGTVNYFANDLVHQQTENGKRQTWQLDADLRHRSWKVETGSGTNWTQTASKLNHYNGDSDNPRWIVEDLATGALTRNVTSAFGDLAATTSRTGDTVLQFTNIHGDIALQLPLSAGQEPVVLDSDEYGKPRHDQAATRYNWLGGKQRSTEALNSATLMGVRLYSPTTGRFLSIDPVYGGNDNAYEYGLGDPVNRYDLTGCTSIKRCGVTYPVTTGWFPLKKYNHSRPSSWYRRAPAWQQGVVTLVLRGFVTDIQFRNRILSLRQWRCSNRHYQERNVAQYQIQAKVTFGYGFFSYNQTTPWLYANYYFWIGPTVTYS